MCCKLGLKIWASEEASNWYLTTRSRPWSWQPAHDPPCLNLTLKIGFLFASWIELFVNIALQHLKTLWWYCPNQNTKLNQDFVWPHPKSPFSPQSLMSPQCYWTLGMLCCDECNWILRCFRKERKDLKGTSGDPTTRELDPQNLISPGWTSQLVGVVG